MGSDSSVTDPKEFDAPESFYHSIINIPENIDVDPLSDCLIYKVPVILRQVNEKAYTPLLISIGPLHHGKEEFSQMEEHKKRYFRSFWGRLPNKKVLVYYEAYLRENEQTIRSCYSEKYDDIKFIDMILLDAVFIMELFLRNLEPEPRENDHMFTKLWISKIIQRDLLLLENQLPIFVLNKLYDTVVPEETKGRYGTFIHLAYKYFDSFDPLKSPDEVDEPNPDDAKKNHLTIKKNHLTSSFRSFREYMCPHKQDENFMNWEKAEHFTDLIRYFYLPKEFHVEPSSDVLRNAMKLNEAGITFEKLTGRRLLDIKFEKKPFFSYFLCLSCLPYFTSFRARFQIPQLKVDHTTECVLRNLIAFELCHYPKTPFICNYVSLIDSLIHTTDDVELLIETQVLVHELGSHKELATLVNGLCRYVVTDGTCYYEIISQLNQHYKNIWNRTMAALRLVYFRDPWRSSSTLIGVVVLIFAIFQFCRVIKLVF